MSRPPHLTFQATALAWKSPPFRDMTIQSHHSAGQQQDEAGFQICPNCGADFPLGSQSLTSLCGRCIFAFASDSNPADCEAGYTGQQPSSSATRVLGSYAVFEEIGRGGMGIIHKAVHRDTGEHVALKTILPQHDGCAETLARFQREAEAASSLDHRYSMPVYEVGCGTDGVPYFSMKLAVGGSLHDLGKKYQGRWHQIADLMTKIAGAIQHAHEQGILHRDLKPGNILFTEDHEPLVTDFGLAQRFISSEGLTQSSSILGTPNYISPEQAAGKSKEATPATDIYGLGAVFYELLTGRPPFVGTNPLDVLRQVSEQSPVRPKRIAPAIPKALEVACMRCLARMPEDRYASAKDFSTDLGRWLKEGKIAKPPFWAPLWRNARRRPVALMGLIGGAILLLALVAGWRSSRPPANTLQPISVAVAMENLDRDDSLDNFTAQATNQIKKAIAGQEGFSVSSGNAPKGPLTLEVFDPLAFARSENTKCVLSGTVRRSGSNVRLAVRLLCCDGGETIWRKLNVFPTERAATDLPTVSREIAAALHARWRTDAKSFSRTPLLSDQPDALAYFTKAKELAARANKSDLDKAVELFRRAVEVDPHFVLARAMLAYSYWSQACVWGDGDKLPLALSAGQAAVSEDPYCAQAHRVIANVNFKNASYANALEEYWTALEIDPNSASGNLSLGICLREMGHPDEAIMWLTRALKLDPVHGVFAGAVGETLVLCGSDSQAEGILQHAIALDPDQPDSCVSLGVLRLWQKHFDQAQTIFADVGQRFPDYRYGSSVTALTAFFSGDTENARTCYKQLRAKNEFQQSWECYGAVNPSSALACIAKEGGMLEQAKSLAEEAVRIDRGLLARFPRNARILHDLAATSAVLGDSGRAIDYLRRAVDAGWVEHRSTVIDPRFRSMAGNVAFDHLLASTFPKAFRAK